MTETSREVALLDAFATLADTLVADYDVVEMLQVLVDTCRDLLDVTAVGLLLADPDSGVLDLVASTSEESRIVETLQLGAEAGPCVECFRTGLPTIVPDIAETGDRWPEFRSSAAEQGFRGVFAIPMRLRDQTIGALNLFRAEAGELNEHDLRAAQALGDVATIGVLHERSFRANDVLRDQLQGALNSRVAIEQAKGVLAHRHEVDMDEAFRMLRSYARSNRLPLAAAARGVVERRIRL
ncbi:GAF and ANTAR domain-containing protein [Amnibacterium sp.]|uniref:GAF and ANTAR domain-containing protein n=1 Tax=Amnibacterium sp. TaxID=1872496 RepID=UPI002620CD0B|nr:GAF and ANTAR domain-containing protein [Amnibacterium sp.]MCU1474084.1 transcriptional regulator [Amnibacterium sp.]